MPDVKLIRLPAAGDPSAITAMRCLWEIMRAPRSLRNLRDVAHLALRQSKGDWRAALVHIRAVLPLLRLKPDVVHFEWLAAAAEWLPYWHLWQCPVVVSCRGRDVTVTPHLPGRECYREAIREAFDKAAAVHCVSEAMRDDAEALGLDPAKGWVIRPAVDPVRFQPGEQRTAAGGPFRIVSVGSLNWWKGYEYSLAAVARLRESVVAVQYEILGDGPKSERQRIQFAIEDLGLSACTTLRGAAGHDLVSATLQRSCCLLLPSLTEGLSNAVLEAMACGLPVVTTNCGGMPEAVTDGVDGMVVAARDIAGMVVALEWLAKNPTLRRRLGEAARSTVLKRFSLVRQTDEFLRLYDSVVRTDGFSRKAA
jgi:colanic acid/amylovoran biosynthesis glycosyltransferase